MRVCLMIEGQESVSLEDWLALAKACEASEIEALFRSDHYLSQTDPERAATPHPPIKSLSHWFHVEIDAATHRPTPIPGHLRSLMEHAVVTGPGT